MKYEIIRSTTTTIASDPDVHKRDKEQIEEFLRTKKTSVEKTTLNNAASQLHIAAEYFDKPLCRLNQEDILNLVGDLNQDNVEKKRGGGTYGESVKRKLFNYLREFCREQLEKEIFEGLNNPADTSKSFDPRTRFSPSQIKQLARESNNLRDRAFIVFGWATGARIGELLYTDESHSHPEGLKWRDIRFKEREMEVTLRGKTGERTIPVRTGISLMTKLQEQEREERNEPVFVQRQITNFCPECESEVTGMDDNNQEYRRYSCDKCDWVGLQSETKEKYKPWDDDSARRQLRRIHDRTNLSDELAVYPHAVFRDSRALYWAAKDKREYFLRGFFGWAEDSDAPSYYVELMDEGVLSGVRQDFGESLDEDEKRFTQDSLKPERCEVCQSWVSSLGSYCNSCGTEVSEELRKHNKDESEMDKLTKVAAQEGYSEEEFRKIVRGVIESM